MEIADLICINKYDTDYKKVCQRLKRQIEGALTLSMSKHFYRGGNWMCPVELVSASTDVNIDTVWKHAIKFKE